MTRNKARCCVWDPVVTYSPSCSRRGWQIWRCWWAEAGGKRESPSKPQSDRRPALERWREWQTPVVPASAPVHWTSCPPPSWHTHGRTRYRHKTAHLPLHISRQMFCWRSGVYLRGNSTSTSIAMAMSRSNTVSLYISCPMRVSQHWLAQEEQEDELVFDTDTVKNDVLQMILTKNTSNVYQLRRMSQ